MATPSISMPDYLVPITDPTWGTQITRICDSPNVVHTYAKKQAWNADETKILLGLGSGFDRVLLDASDYSVLNAAVGGDGDWDPLDPDLLVRVNSTSGAVFGYDPETNTNTGTIKNYAAYASGSQFNNMTQSNPSDDGRYWLFTGRTSGAQNVVLLWDRTLDSTAVLNVTTKPHSGTMSHSGDYLHLNWDTGGTGDEQGIWLLDNTLTRIRQISEQKAHADFCRDSDGAEVFVWIANATEAAANSGRILSHRCSDGNLVVQLGPAAIAFRHGHVSGRATDRPGWVYLSVYDVDTANQPGQDQTLALKLDGSGTVQVFAHEHDDMVSGFPTDAMSVPNRNGTQLIFHSSWDGADGYEFLAEQV